MTPIAVTPARNSRAAGVLALDLDGTILLPGETLVPGLQDEVQAWQRAGWQVAIITARHRKLPLIDDLRAGAYTRNYGAQVFTQGRELVRRTLPAGVVAQALELAPAGARCMALTPQQAFVSTLRHPEDRPLHEWPQGQDFVKVLLEHPDEQVVEVMAQGWGALPGVTVICERPNARMLIARRADKGSALREIAAFYGVPLLRTLAVGDGHSDAAMLDCAGSFVRVGQNPRLKAAAFHVATPHEVPAALAQLRERLTLG